VKVLIIYFILDKKFICPTDYRHQDSNYHYHCHHLKFKDKAHINVLFPKSSFFPFHPQTSSFQLIIDLYSSPNIVRVIKSRRMRWTGHVVRMGEERGVCRILVGKPEGRRPLGRPRGRWVDNIRMDLQEVGCGYMDWIGLAQDRDSWRKLVSAVMNFGVP